MLVPKIRLLKYFKEMALILFSIKYISVQGSAADIVKTALLRMERNLKKYQNHLKINIQNDAMTSVNLVLHLHDELIYEVPQDKAKAIAKILKYSMENCVKFSIPLNVKIKMGQNWGSLMEIKI